MAIELHDFVNPLVAVYEPNGKLVCKTRNECKFLDILCQIKEQKLEGYYIIFNKERYEIERGYVQDSPKELFEHTSKLLSRLMGF